MADEKQPSCSACQRLGVTCPGPQKRTTFIQEYPNQRRKAPSRPAALGSSTDAPRLSQKASTTSPPYLAAQTWLSGRSLHAAQRWNLTLPKEAYYTTLFVSKFNNTVPAGVWSPFSWLNYGVVADNGDATISHRFAQNLTQAFFAHYFALPRVMNAAQVGYGRNLLILKESLDIPEMIASEDLFHGILTAVIFELITQTSSSAWIIHIIALAKIIQVSKTRKALAGSRKCPVEITSLLESRTKRIPIIVRKVWNSLVPFSHCKTFASWTAQPCISKILILYILRPDFQSCIAREHSSTTHNGGLSYHNNSQAVYCRGLRTYSTFQYHVSQCL